MSVIKKDIIKKLAEEMSHKFLDHAKGSVPERDWKDEFDCLVDTYMELLTMVSKSHLIIPKGDLRTTQRSFVEEKDNPDINEFRYGFTSGVAEMVEELFNLYDVEPLI